MVPLWYQVFADYAPGFRVPPFGDETIDAAPGEASPTHVTRP
jgi:hypothetical protein